MTSQSISLIKPFRASMGPNFTHDLAKITQYAKQSTTLNNNLKWNPNLDVPSQDDKVRYRPNPFTNARVCASLSLGNSISEGKHAGLASVVEDNITCDAE